MKKFILFPILFFSFSLFASPNFPCDSIRVDSVVVNQPAGYLQVYMFNTSQQTFTMAHLNGTLAANMYITLSSQYAIATLFDRYGGPNGGATQFHVNGTIPLASSVPTGTVFTGTVTLTDPNNANVNCPYPISFTYGTGPVGIENYDAKDFKLNCFPNPATTEIFLEENKLSVNKTFLIYDCTGKIILQSNSNRINISDFSPGVYFFSDEKQLGKFVKL